MNATHSAARNPARICLLGASFATPNFGVNVLTLGTIRSLLNAWPDARISIMDYAKEPQTYRLHMEGQEIEIPLVNIRFSKKPWQPNHILFLLLLACVFRVTPGRGLKGKILSWNPWLNELQQADFVTAISGGDSFSDIYGMERFFYVALPQILTLILGRKLILLPQTLGPYRRRITRSVARFILRGAERIYSRDKQGLQVAKLLLGEEESKGKLFLKPDVGFVVLPEVPRDERLLRSIHEWKQRGPLIGVNVSGMLYMGGYSRKNMFELKTDYRQLIDATIRWVRSVETATLLLVPHVLGEEGSESDVPVCRTVYRDWQQAMGEQIQLVDSALNEREVKYVIGQCDFFSGARMHACIAAISQCVPTVPVAYSDKFTGVMETVGIESLVADPRFMIQEQIISLMEKSFQDRTAIRQRLMTTIPAAIQSTLALFADLGAASKPGTSAGLASFEREETPNSAIQDAKLRAGSGDSNLPKFPDAG